MATTRTCAGCSTNKPLTGEHFYKHASMPGGFEYRCKSCERERARWRNILRLYGLTPEDYAALMEAQGGTCVTCPATGVLDIDHDHETGLVRGLLCRRCNVTLGLTDEDPERLERLAAYLRNTLP